MIYASLLVASFLLTYIIKNYAIKKSFLASVNERSSHTVPTPHGGGVAIALTWFSGLFYFYFLGEIDSRLFYALLFGAILSTVSFFDDIYELSPKIRLFFQAIVASAGLYSLGGFTILSFGVFDIQNSIFTNIFAFFMIVWFINLYNFLDGIDAYAASEAIFLALGGFVFFGGAHFLVLAASVAGFLVWNWEKAKIFMGDVGSTLLGYNVAIFTLYYANEEPSNFWIWIILFGVFWFDATLTLFRRYRNGEKLSLAHKKHIYQSLVQSGWSHKRVVIASIFVNLILFLIIYITPSYFIAFLAMLIILYFITLFVDSKKDIS